MLLNGFLVIGKNFLSALESCNYNFILLMQYIYVTYKLITNFVKFPTTWMSYPAALPEPWQKKCGEKAFFGDRMLAQLRHTHAFFVYLFFHFYLNLSSGLWNLRCIHFKVILVAFTRLTVLCLTVKHYLPWWGGLGNLAL